MELGDRVTIRTTDSFNGMRGTIMSIEADEQGIGLVTILFQGEEVGGVEDFGWEELELAGSNIFQDYNGH
jgi:hypothetical protein